jgi:hypothetical protein
MNEMNQYEAVLNGVEIPGLGRHDGIPKRFEADSNKSAWALVDGWTLPDGVTVARVRRLWSHWSDVKRGASEKAPETAPERTSVTAETSLVETVSVATNETPEHTERRRDKRAA